jgi:hypothetical protein
MSYHKVVKIWGVLLPVETGYTKNLPERVSSYHILYSYGRGRSTPGLILHSTRNTHFIDELILLLGVLKLIFRNGRFHVDKSKQKQSKGKGMCQRDAHRWACVRFSRLICTEGL